MNILLINHYAGSVTYGMEYRPYYLAKEWTKMGHKVTILAASYSHIRAKQPDLNGKAIKYESIENINYRWYQTAPHQGNGIGRVKNILGFLRAIKHDTGNIIAEANPDVVIASSTYPMDIWSAHHLAKKANAQLIYEVHDLWPLSPMELGGMSRWHPFIIWCQLAENYAYRHVAKVVSMLPNALSHMRAHGMNPKKFHYVPNGIAVDEWEDAKPLPSQLKNKISQIKALGQPIVGYAGTHGLANALDALLDAAKLAGDKFQVILIGKGPDKDLISKRVKNENINNVTLLPAITKEYIPAFLSEIDIAYIGLLPQPLFRFGISPNKLMDYMFAAKPVVMAIDAGNDPVTEAGCGLTVKPNDVNAIYDAIIKLASLSPQEMQEIGEKGRAYILAKQTYSVLARKFINIIENY